MLYHVGMGKFNVGKTKRSLKLRFPDHKSNISKKRIDAVLVGHFLQHNHIPTGSLFGVTFKSDRQDDRILLRKGAKWILNLKTLHPTLG